MAERKIKNMRFKSPNRTVRMLKAMGLVLVATPVAVLVVTGASIFFLADGLVAIAGYIKQTITDNWKV